MVKVIGNEMDMTLIDLTGVLPSATIMVVTVTGTYSSAYTTRSARTHTLCHVSLTRAYQYASMRKPEWPRPRATAVLMSTHTRANRLPHRLALALAH